MTLPRSAFICEVGPRDGLQAESAILRTADKIALVDALSATGVRRIQVTSFAHPKWIPQLADAEQVMAGIERVDGVEYNVLAPNGRGFERAVEIGCNSICLVVSASPTHNRKNLNREPSETLRDFQRVLGKGADSRVRVSAAIATAFGCPYEGTTPANAVIDLVERLRELGVEEVGLGDTTGMANPVQVEALSGELLTRFPDLPLVLHFHNTRGMGLANIVAGLRAGVERFDASIGGLGGCPYAPGATGNVATEDVVHMLEEMRVECGIELDELIECAGRVQQLVGHELPSSVLKAGKVSETVPIG
jgi:hydroxymethylglutaryl-CoA lyase